MSESESAEWHRLARIDLESARVLAAFEPPLIEPALFHCAQAAEKALKSVIVRGGQVPPKTHNLGTLLSAARGVNPSLAVHAPDAMLLNGYAVDPRYPRAGAPYTVDELAAAIAAVERIVRAVETS